MSEATKMYEDKMNKTLNNLSEEYITIRAGRANPHILDKIKVDYYGQPSPIQSVANISVPEARIILGRQVLSRLLRKRLIWQILV